MVAVVSPELLQSAVPDLLHSVFGSEARLDNAQVVNCKTDYLVALLEISPPRQTVVIKIAGPQAAETYAFDRTAAVFDLVRRYTNIPVPEVYALDTSYSHWPWRYMLRSHLPGQEWAQINPTLSEAEREDAFHQLGEAVAQLHNIPFPGFGALDVHGKVPHPLGLFEALLQRAHAFIPDDDFYHFFAETLQTRQVLFNVDSRPGLVHEDLHQHNLIFSHEQGHWQLATLLDFDKAWAGPPESDLARLDLWRGMSHPAFWQAYQRIKPIEARFSERKLLYQLLWCLEFARPDAQHWQDTTEVCDALGLHMPKQFAQMGL